MSVSEATKKRIIALNKYDYQLFEYAKEKIDINNKKFTFNKVNIILQGYFILNKSRACRIYTIYYRVFFLSYFLKWSIYSQYFIREHF